MDIPTYMDMCDCTACKAPYSAGIAICPSSVDKSLCVMARGVCWYLCIFESTDHFGRTSAKSRKACKVMQRQAGFAYLIWSGGRLATPHALACDYLPRLTFARIQPVQVCYYKHFQSNECPCHTLVYYKSCHYTRVPTGNFS